MTKLISHVGAALLEGALIAAIVVAVVAGSVFAARGGGGGKPTGGGTTTARCSVSPSPVAVGGEYAITGSGYRPGELITVWVTDSHGMQSLFPPVDADGTFTATSYASWAGTSRDPGRPRTVGWSGHLHRPTPRSIQGRAGIDQRQTRGDPGTQSHGTANTSQPGCRCAGTPLRPQQEVEPTVTKLITHVGAALLEGALIAAVVVALIAGSAFAARGGGNGGTGGGKPSGGGTTTARCSVSPSTVAVGGEYMITGSGLKPGELITVWVTDPHGMQSLFPPVDTDGTFTATSYASWAGASTARVYDNGGRKMVYLTSCGFTVG